MRSTNTKRNAARPGKQQRSARKTSPSEPVSHINLQPINRHVNRHKRTPRFDHQLSLAMDEAVVMSEDLNPAVRALGNERKRQLGRLIWGDEEV